MARVLAIDYGTKRVGLAVTDSMQIIASPLNTVPAKDLAQYLEKYINTEEVETIVIGMPKRLNNTDTHITQQVREFTIHMTRKFPAIKIVNVDERFTSKMAFETMIAGGLSKKKRREKELIDKVSATIILQSYLAQQI